MRLLAVFCLVALVLASSDSGRWDYRTQGPSKWAELFPLSCDGERQSPIDLSTGQSVQSPLVKGFTFNQRTNKGTTITFTLKNDGHKVGLSWSPELTMQMGLSQTYKAAQLHWHWGADSRKGSEHTVNNRPYAAEGHLVFYSTQYASVAEAANKPDGLAVVGVFYETAEQDNPLFAKLDAALGNENLVNANGIAEVTMKSAEVNLLDWFLPSNRKEFFRYNGSLTTPPCSESVLWTVFRQPVPISERQLQLLRRLKFAGNVEAMTDNFRPPLPLNPGKRPGTPRTVYRTFAASAALTGLPLVTLATVAMLARLVATHAA